LVNKSKLWRLCNVHVPLLYTKIVKYDLLNKITLNILYIHCACHKSVQNNIQMFEIGKISIVLLPNSQILSEIKLGNEYENLPSRDVE